MFQNKRCHRFLFLPQKSVLLIEPVFSILLLYLEFKVFHEIKSDKLRMVAVYIRAVLYLVKWTLKSKTLLKHISNVLKIILLVQHARLMHISRELVSHHQAGIDAIAVSIHCCMRNWWKDFAVSDKLFKFHLGRSIDDVNRWHHGCYKNLLIIDRSVVKPCWLFCRKFASSSKNRFPPLDLCAPLELTVRSKNQRVVNSYVVALGKIMLKLP